MPVEFEPPVDTLSPDFPMRLTTGRRLDSFNTGVQTGGYTSPLRFGETIDLAPEDGVSLGVAEGERVRIVSRRGAVDAPVRFDRGLRPGLAFMTHALSRRGRHQPADDRRDRSEVRHRGVQGVGDSDRETLSGPSPDSRGESRRPKSAKRSTRSMRWFQPGTGSCPRSTPLTRAVGWISEGALNHICERLSVPPAEAYGVASFYAHVLAEAAPAAVVHVCDDIACRANGAEALCRDARATRRQGRRSRHGRPGDVAAEPVSGPVRSCAGRARPACRDGAADSTLTGVTADDVVAELNDQVRLADSSDAPAVPSNIP